MASHQALKFLFGFLFLFSLTHAYLDDYQCDHDNHDFVADELDVDEDMDSLTEGRTLANTEYPKTRFKAYYGFLDSAPASFKVYIQDLAPPVLDYLSLALRAKYPVKGQLKLGSSVKNVCDMPVPQELRDGVEADVYVIFDSRSEDSSVVASSKYCHLAVGTKRPLITYTNINRQMLMEANGNVLIHEKNMYLLIHEIMHTLGISRNSYDFYMDESGNRRKGHLKTRKIAGVTHTLIDVPPVTERLRKYYDCPSIEGAIMENDGGSGTASSHLERKFFVYEVMSSGGIFGRRVSEFSLAILEGSGWYAPDYTMAEPYFFGKGQGCNFLNQKCSSNRATFDEFCTGSGRGCSPTGRGGGRCSGDSKTEGCRYYDPELDYDCENPDAEDNARLSELQVFGRGAGSKCFTGTLNSRRSSGGLTSFCFRYTCVEGESGTTLEVRVGEETITCEREGERTINGYYGAVNCPDPNVFCSGPGKKYCPRGCMGRGRCVDNRCQCFEGFGGVDCGMKA